jgi:ornithine--oxo-acid transaminase
VDAVGEGADLDVEADQAPQAGGESGHADVPVAAVGDHDHVGAQLLEVLLQQGGETVGADLLLTLDEHHDVHREVVAVGAQGTEVGHDAGLVVGGTAGVQPAVALGRLEGRGVPVGVVVLGLDVVVGVEQHGRCVVPGRPLVGDQRRPAAVRAGDPALEALGGEQVAHRLGTALHLARAVRVGADRLDPDQRLEVASYAGKDVAHPRAEVGGEVVGSHARQSSEAHDTPKLSDNHLASGGPVRDHGAAPLRAPDVDESSPMNHHTPGTAHHIELTETYAAHNYHPLHVVLASGEGAWVTDVDGRRYLDCLAGYSALNFGHGHPRLVEVAREQIGRLTLTSRAFYNDQLGPFAESLADLTGKDMILPMNSGAEAVETAIKVSRKWGYQVKGVQENQATIVAMENNFHGRTTTIVSFSTDPDATHDYAPYTPGFRLVPYGDVEALRAAIDDTTVAVLLEPVQGEAGVVIPPEGYLRDVRALCRAENVLMVADEIQSGLARTGRTFACDHEGVVPDMYILGKALGGGLYPVSAVAADRDVLGVITPGTHGSTFGGNPLAAAIGREVVAMLETGEFQERAAKLGEQLYVGLSDLVGFGIDAVRARGLWAGIDIASDKMTGRDFTEALLAKGILAKEAHGQTVRLAPPIVASESDIDLLVDSFREVITA